MRSTPPCPFCEKAKALLDKRGLRYEAIDLTGRHTALLGDQQGRFEL